MADNDGAPGVPPPSLKIEAGQSIKDLKIKLIPLAIITGRVLDHDGDPIRGARVEAVAYIYQSGKKQLNSVEQISANDQGEFRLFGLHPGTIYLRASGHDGGTGSFAPTYFPGTKDAVHASPIDLEAGAQLRGIDILLRREMHHSVRGKLPDEFKHQGARSSLQILPRDGSGADFSMRQDDETFEFLNVFPGSYVIVGAVTTGGKHSVVREPVEVVNADVEGVTLRFVPPINVSGVVRVEGAAPRPLDNLSVILESDTQGQSGARVKPDGTFTISDDVLPDVYRITVGSQPGAYVKALRFGDEEVNDGRIDLTKGSGPVTVLLSTDVGAVEGSVKKANGDPAVRVRVTLIASGNHLGRSDLSRYAFTDEQGKFHVPDVPPGEYQAFAWSDAPFGAPQDPDFRKPFEKRAVSVKLDPNGHATIDLTAISIKPAQ